MLARGIKTIALEHAQAKEERYQKPALSAERDLRGHGERLVLLTAKRKHMRASEGVKHALVCPMLMSDSHARIAVSIAFSTMLGSKRLRIIFVQEDVTRYSTGVFKMN